MARTLFLVSLLSVLLLVPVVALAAPSWLPIVPCGGHTASGDPQPECTPCYMFQAVKNASDLVFYGITGPVAAFMFVVAGGMMLLGAGNPGMQQRAKTLFTNTVIGVAIIFVAWIATDFILKNITTSDTTDHWYEFTCPSFLASITADGTTAPAIPTIRPIVTPASITASTITAAQMQEEAISNHEKYPRQNSSTLKNLIQCIYQDPIVKAMALPPPNLEGSARQTTGIVTYDNDNEYCNYSRGVPLSGGGACSHAVNSCHYGGRTGSNGAEAVDINARRVPVPLPGTDDGAGHPIVAQASEENLFCQLYNLLMVRNKCSDFGFINWESSSKGAHTHISTNVCTADGTGSSRSSTREVKALDCPNGARIPSPSPAP